MQHAPVYSSHHLSGWLSINPIMNMRACTVEAPAAALAHPPRPQARPRLQQARCQHAEKRLSQPAGRARLMAGGFDGQPVVAPAAAPASPRLHRRHQMRGILLSATLLSAAIIASSVLGGSSRRGIASAAGASISESSGGVHIAVVAPLQQTSPFGISWAEVLEHTAQRLAWADPAFRLTLYDTDELVGGGADTQAALHAALAGAQAAVALGVQDPADAAALAPLLAAAPTALALGSAAPLAGATRLAGRAPAAQGGNPLAALLAKLFPDKQAKLDAQVRAWTGTCDPSAGTCLPPSALEPRVGILTLWYRLH